MDEARRIADALLLPQVFGASWPKAAAEMMGEALKLRETRQSCTHGHGAAITALVAKLMVGILSDSSLPNLVVQNVKISEKALH
jgi:hypothetical protein